jgi:hypothetical protein
MAFMLPALASAIGGMLFRKKGGKVIQQTPNGQAFMQAKPVALKAGGFVDGLRAMNIMPTPIRKKKGGRVKKSKTKKQKK